VIQWQVVNMGECQEAADLL